MVGSGNGAVYDRKSSSQFRVLWMPKAKLVDVVLFRQTHAKGRPHGPALRSTTADAESLHAELKPSSMWLLGGGLRHWHVGAWPHGVQRPAISNLSRHRMGSAGGWPGPNPVAGTPGSLKCRRPMTRGRRQLRRADPDHRETGGTQCPGQGTAGTRPRPA